jgi:hypothetical protein
MAASPETFLGVDKVTLCNPYILRASLCAIVDDGTRIHPAMARRVRIRNAQQKDPTQAIS